MFGEQADAQFFLSATKLNEIECISCVRKRGRLFYFSRLETRQPMYRGG